MNPSNLQTILEELYRIDPSLKDHEESLTKLVSELLAARPNVELDERFARDLKYRLLEQMPQRESFLSLLTNNFLNMRKYALAIGVAALLLVVGVPLVLLKQNNAGEIKQNPLDKILSFITPSTTPNVTNQTAKIAVKQLGGLRQFSSNKEFQDYLALARNTSYGFGGGFGGVATGLAESSVGMKSTALQAPMAADTSASAPSRYSETNVQVMGIDEPDIVKTDGKEIYYSTWGSSYGPIRPMMKSVSGGIIAPESMPYYQQGEVKLIEGFPVDALKLDGKIDKNGELLLSKNILAVFSGNKIYGYDVSDKTKPTQKWTVEFGERNGLVGARLYNGQIYFATREYTYEPGPCPLVPLTVNGSKIEIRCTDIYYPPVVIQADSVYHVVAIDAATGEVKNKTSFIGSSSESVLYMSNSAIYLTYYYPGDIIKYSYNFLSENKDIVPSWVIEKLGKLQTYDISDNAKMAEYQDLVNKWQLSLSNDDRLKLQNELTNRMSDYSVKHRRELEQTGIVKIALDGLKIVGNGNVPGRLLNQFSMDEYQNNLRVATTIGQGWWGIGMFGGSTKSVSDVYTLSSDMKVLGAVKDLGEDERIYSVRFIGDRGYVVTFKQIDPFYVLDLADANNPKLAGELKIPGYSSYLQPLGDHSVLGIGMEDNQVKLSIFDVSNPNKPTEMSKFKLDEYWSEALNNHRAFLLDSKNQVFFLPGGKGGYVFSYVDNQLKLVKAISGYQVQRALYIDDNMYIVSQDKITVFNIMNWEKVNELVF